MNMSFVNLHSQTWSKRDLQVISEWGIMRSGIGPAAVWGVEWICAVVLDNPMILLGLLQILSLLLLPVLCKARIVLSETMGSRQHFKRFNSLHGSYLPLKKTLFSLCCYRMGVWEQEHKRPRDTWLCCAITPTLFLLCAMNGGMFFPLAGDVVKTEGRVGISTESSKCHARILFCWLRDGWITLYFRSWHSLGYEALLFSLHISLNQTTASFMNG